MNSYVSLLSNVAAVMGTRDVDVEEAARIVLRNHAVNRAIDNVDVSAQAFALAQIMRQSELQSNERSMPTRKPRDRTLGGPVVSIDANGNRSAFVPPKRERNFVGRLEETYAMKAAKATTTQADFD